MKPKELYLGSCVQDLNAMAEKLDKTTSPKIYLKSMLKIVEGAQKADQEGDQEKAYVLFMRYCSIFQLIIRSREYSIHKIYYDSMLNRKQIEAAMNRIEDLQKKLNTRFEELEARKLLAKRDEEKKKKEQVSARIEAAPAPTDPPSGPDKPWLSPTAFAYQLRQPKPPLVFDLRPKPDAEAFPLKAEDVINLDPSCLPQSATVRHITEALQNDIAGLARFERRGEASSVVLIDDNSKPPLSGTLKRVKEALFDWDASQVLTQEPYLVEGGFENFFLHFPTLVANAQKYREVIKERDLKARSRDVVEIQYPDLEERNRRKKEEAMEAERLRQEAAMEAERRQKEEAMEAERRRRRRAEAKAMEAERERAEAEAAMEAERRQKEEAMEAERRRRLRDAEKERNKEKQRNKAEDRAPDVSDPPAPSRPQKAKKEKQRTPPASPKSLPKSSEKPKPDKAVTEPKPEKPAAEPSPEKTTKKPKPEKAVTEPKPDKAVTEPKPDKAVTEPKPDKVSSKPKPEKTTTEPKPEKTSTESKPETLAKEPKAEKSKKERKSSPAGTDRPDKAEEPSKESANRSPSPKPGHRKKSPERRMQGDERPVPVVNRALKPVISNNQNEAKVSPGSGPLLVAKEQRIPSPNQWAVRGGARIQTSQPTQAQQQQQQPEVGAAASTWERRVDSATGREYFVDLTTFETRWADGSSRPPQHPATRITKMPLKDEHWSSSSSGSGTNSGARLKRSGSQPNLAITSHDTSTAYSAAASASSSSSSFTAVPSSSSLSRDAIGGEVGVPRGATSASNTTRPSVPSRETKPRSLGETELSAFDSETLRLMYAEYGTTERGLTGLRNLGNSCYMNSVLQALSNTPCLVQYIISNNYRRDINRNNPAGHGGEVAEEFATLLRALWTGNYRIISPIKFKRTVGRKNSMFATNEQQDSQEFLLFLLDGLHEDFNAGQPRKGAPAPPALLEDENAPLLERAGEAWRWHKRFNSSFVVSFFQGQFRSTMRCLTCNSTSTTFDVFMYLSLQIPSNSRCSLRDCISQFSKEERMAGSSQWFCPRCRQKRDAVKHLAIWRLPPYLLIHLKRFSFEQSLRAKMNTLVDFPLTDMQIEQEAGQPHKYNLYAVSNHYGSMESGHYTAYCLNPGLWRWFKFDDDVVSPIGESQIRSSAAYILFYATQRGGTGQSEWFG